MKDRQTPPQVAQNKAPAFEHQACTRCGGSGNYSYCSMYGTTCFKCSGSGYALTKRGAAAQEHFRRACAIDPADVKVGDRVETCGRKYTVAEVLGTREAGARIHEDGTRTPLIAHYFVSKQGTRFGVQGGVPIRLIPLGERRAAMIAESRAYQSTLTKAGKPRKVAA